MKIISMMNCRFRNVFAQTHKKEFAFLSKVTNVKNTTISFVKNNPRAVTTGIGLVSMLVGVTTGNIALVSVGISALVGAALYVPPLVTQSPNQENVSSSQCPEAG